MRGARDRVVPRDGWAVVDDGSAGVRSGPDVPLPIFVTLLEALPGAALLLDRTHRLVLVNRALARRFGLSPEAFAGRPSSDFLPPDLLARRLKAVDEVFVTGRGVREEDEREGRLYENRIEPLPGSDGRPRFVLLHSTDVTAARQVERELGSQVAFREALATCLGSGLAAVDADDRLAFVNSAFCRMCGWSEEELLGRSPPFPFWPPSEVSPVGKLYGDVTSGAASPGGFEIPLLRKDGSLLPVHMTTAPLVVGGTPSGWLASFVDLTARTEAEDALRRNEEKTRAILETTLSPFLLLDTKGRVLEVNEATCLLVGRRPEQLVGHTARDLVAGAPPGRVETRLARAVAEGSLRFDTRVRAADGRLLDVEVSLSRLDVDGGRLVCFLHDVTEARAAAEAVARERSVLAERVAERTAELSRANEELSRASRLKDEFLASTSHELRTPLTTILGLADLLLAGGRGALSEPQARAVGMVKESGAHLLALITDILDVSKIGAGRLELSLGWVDLRGLCEAALALVAPSALKKRHTLSLDAPSKRSLFRADERRVKQVLVNLLGNAVKFTPPGGTIGVEARADADRGEVRVSVRDSGPGIAPEARGRLFRPFVQLDARLAREHEGSGLGLVLVDRLVALHGGRVELESEPGRGSRFTVVFPWVRRDGGATAPGGRPGTALPERSPDAPPGTRVLLVEDNATQAELFAEALGAAGFRVEAARNGLEALERAAEIGPDVVVMDVQMPGMDGLEATRRLRATPALRETPVLALTALVMPGDRERCRAAGVDEYLAKPVPLAELVAAVSRLARRGKG